MPSSLFPSSPSSPSGMGSLAGVVSALRHNDPQTFAYNAGPSPFCGGCGCSI